ncbi:GMC oxidoreductase [Mesorhizobium sp. M0488]|uniref:GMC oxidoreductase n=1 Tax=unclassified Mesorhizobium TaxID=325217 RepID=UPI003336C5A8
MGAAASSANFNYGYPTPGPQSPTGQQVMNNDFFLSGTQWKKAREEGIYDLVVIGSGFCGLAVVHKALERDPFCRILMIERGTFFLPEHFQNLPIPFVETMGGLAETFPWTLSSITATGLEGGSIRWQHGMVPFFGGRSTLWSAWCPRPTTEEMEGWPKETIAAARRHFEAAEKLLHVQPANKVDADVAPEMLLRLAKERPVYGPLQNRMQALLKEAPGKIASIYRTEPAPLASDAQSVDGLDFQKFATPGEVLGHVRLQSDRAKVGLGAPFHIVAGCVVERIVQQFGAATALETSMGVLPLGAAKLILTMGSLPAATLVRNAFPDSGLGDRFASHFTSSITARVPRKDFDPNGAFHGLQLGACYVAGKDGSYARQFHIQISAVSDPEPVKNAGIALRYMPDVLTTATMAQLLTSRDHVIYPCATLGELDCHNPQTWYRGNPDDADPTTNSLLQVVENAGDRSTWDTMDEATFRTLEDVLSPKGPTHLEYWHGSADAGEWRRERPNITERRNTALVHDSSTLHIGSSEDAPVDLDYRLRAAKNIYVTGGALWPKAGSWNPTMTMVGLAFDLVERLVPESDRKKAKRKS